MNSDETQRRIRARRISKGIRHSRGQALVIIALAFVALLGFVGLVTDVGSLYVTYTQLKRAVDAAAVAAANNIKYPQASEAQRKQKITEAAREMLAFHGITNVNTLVVYLCSDTGLPPDFDEMCPNVGDAPRKLAYVQATQDSPVFFLRLFGIQDIPFTTSSVGEAATVDLVLVFDTSESMGLDSPGYDLRNFNPATCNGSNNCQPLRDAKDAAKSLIGLLFDGYDRVAIVTFNYEADEVFALSSVIGDDDHDTDGDAFDAIDHLVLLHDDAPAAKLPWTVPSPNYGYRRFNPIWPEDRDGDGSDDDDGAPCEDLIENNTDPPNYEPDLWDDTSGDPCDQDDILDTFDWDGDGDHYILDMSGNIIGGDDDVDRVDGTFEDTSLLSTCTGCGVRVGANVLRRDGRPNSVWVMVFLSDGVANLSDLPLTNGDIPTSFTYGFCGTDPSTSFWTTYCIDRNVSPSAGRFCIDSDSDECPPSSTPTNDSGPYSVEDYAYDMIDSAALLESANDDEPIGDDIIIYSIGLGAASNGEALLRYMANVGDEGSRENDECNGVVPLRACGNYYYAPSASYLNQIFESIANRIFTKISR